MTTPFNLSADEIALIRDLRKLSEHERHIITTCIHSSATEQQPPERLPREVPPLRQAR